MLKFLMLSLTTALAIASSSSDAATAISGAQTASGYAYFWCSDANDVTEATTCAIRRCKTEASGAGADSRKCHVLDTDPAHGWWAIYEREDGGLSWAFARDRQAAIDGAYNKCAKLSRCGDDAAHVFSDGHLPPAKPINREERWRTVCNNGACTRTYADGRHVRFNACLNPTTGVAFDNLDGSCSGFDMTGLAFGQRRANE